MPEIGTAIWVDALARAIAAVEADGVEITVLHRIDGGPGWVLVADGTTITARVAVDADVAAADVTFTWQRDDLDAVANGATAPLAVFQAGRLRVGGDLRRLADATDLFARFPGVPV